jgi:hypothetical protein
MSEAAFYVEFKRPGGQVLLGRLIAKLKGTKVDFRFEEFQGQPVYTIDLKDGQPVYARHKGKFFIDKEELPGVRDGVHIFGDKKTLCHYCKGPAFNRPRGTAPPRETRLGDKYVWCCGACRQPELLR